MAAGIQPLCAFRPIGGIAASTELKSSTRGGTPDWPKTEIASEGCVSAESALRRTLDRFTPANQQENATAALILPRPLARLLDVVPNKVQ